MKATLHYLQVPALCAAALALTACGGSGKASSAPASVSSASRSASGYRGDQLGTPLVLTAADDAARFRTAGGGSTTLSALQQGKLMLLYFGYTHCPDVCPTTMADLGQALRQLPVQVQLHTQVVFVTSDPARDTPAVMKSWLGNFDAGLPVPFAGLTAPLSQTDRVATTLGVPLSPPVTAPDGTVTVQHGAQTMAFVGGKASLLWLAGTTVADYAHDITALLEHDPT
ncbi:MAG TPA: SCO family protein [Jatrophihabitans sp.]|nr:SCO family protein [Jatrophihabitans sp.]